MLSYYISSLTRNGLGLILSTLGILLLFLLHHVNLCTIKEPSNTRYPRISYSFVKLTVSFSFVLLFQAIASLFSILFTWIFMYYMLEIFWVYSLPLFSFQIFHKPKWKFEIVCKCLSLGSCSTSPMATTKKC